MLDAANAILAAASQHGREERAHSAGAPGMYRSPRMNRRSFLRRTGATAAGLALWNRAPLAAGSDDPAWRTFQITTRVTVLQPRGATRVWLPTPLAVAPYQRTMGDTYHPGNGTAVMIETNANEPDHSRLLVGRRNRAGADAGQPGGDHGSDRRSHRAHGRPAPRSVGLQPFPQTGAPDPDRRDRADHRRDDRQRRADRPASGRARSTTGSSTTPTAIRKMRGCGTGDIKLHARDRATCGGKCADLNALFVGAARAPRAFPARDVYGVRVRRFATLGYKSLGKTRRHHQGAALPRRVLLAGLRLGAGRSGRRPQGDARGSRRQAAPTIRWCVARAQAPLRLVGDELARLQLRARRALPRLAARQGRLPHVSAGRDRRRPRSTASTRSTSSIRSPLTRDVTRGLSSGGHMIPVVAAAWLALAVSAPSDRLVDAAGVKLHIRCDGERAAGAPLVVLEAVLATAPPPGGMSSRTAGAIRSGVRLRSAGSRQQRTDACAAVRRRSGRDAARAAAGRRRTAAVRHGGRFVRRHARPSSTRCVIAPRSPASCWSISNTKNSCSGSPPCRCCRRAWCRSR